MNEELKEENKEKMNMRDIVDILKYPVIVFIVFYTLFQFVLFSGVVPSESMENTIKARSWIVGERFSVKNKENIKRYDVVVFKHKEGGEETLLVKRVIGLPGDHIKVEVNGAVYINGELSEDSFTSSPGHVFGDKEFTVPEGEYFMLGDNRSNSYDSRKWEYPYIKHEDIIAKVFLNYYLWDANIIKNEYNKD